MGLLPVAGAATATSASGGLLVSWPFSGDSDNTSNAVARTRLAGTSTWGADVALTRTNGVKWEGTLTLGSGTYEVQVQWYDPTAGPTYTALYTFNTTTEAWYFQSGYTSGSGTITGSVSLSTDTPDGSAHSLQLDAAGIPVGSYAQIQYQCDTVPTATGSTVSAQIKLVAAAGIYRAHLSLVGPGPAYTTAEGSDVDLIVGSWVTLAADPTTLPSVASIFVALICDSPTGATFTARVDVVQRG